MTKRNFSNGSYRLLTLAPLGYSAERAPLGGGILPSFPNSRTSSRNEAGEAVSKALNKYLAKEMKKINNVTSQVNVRSNIKIVTFLPIAATKKGC